MPGKVGDCSGGFDKIYDYLSTPGKPWADIPWGLGAWGTPEMNWDPPLADKRECILGTRRKIESGDYPKMKATINFNSNLCIMDDSKQPQLIDTFKEYLAAPYFYDDSVDYDEDCSLFIEGTPGC